MMPWHRMGALVARFGHGWRMALAVFFLASAGMIHPTPAAADDDAAACQRAGLEAERKADLPFGLLRAIGRVESGRVDPASGRVAAWPWTINANGAGQLFGSRPEALTATRALLGRGVTSIDVGCFQINLFHHPTAFSSLDEAFDPHANAAYAARFLLELRARTGSWENAVAAYHSANAELGGPYRDRVLAGLAHSDMAPRLIAPYVRQTAVWTQESVAGPVKIWTPSAAGLAPSIITIRALQVGPPTALPLIKVPRRPE